MLALLTNCTQLTCITACDFNMAFTKHWFYYASSLIDLLSNEILSSYITEEIINLTMKHADSKLIKSLFVNASNVVQQSVIEDVLYHAAIIDDSDLFEFIVDTEILVPKFFDNGETLLTNFLLSNKIKFSFHFI